MPLAGDHVPAVGHVALHDVPFVRGKRTCGEQDLERRHHFPDIVHRSAACHVGDPIGVQRKARPDPMTPSTDGARMQRGRAIVVRDPLDPGVDEDIHVVERFRTGGARAHPNRQRVECGSEIAQRAGVGVAGNPADGRLKSRNEGCYRSGRAQIERRERRQTGRTQHVEAWLNQRVESDDVT